MAHYLVQCSLQDMSGLAQDRYINTFHIDAVGHTGEELTALVAAFNKFYNETSSLAHSITHYIANHAGNTPGTVKIYNQSDTSDREPIKVGILSLSSGLTEAVALPAEVACCISYKGHPVTGQPITTTHGRVYIGPLNTNAVEAVGDFPARPNQDMRTEFISHFARLIVDVAAAGDFELKQYSAKHAALHAITEIWSDDAWDTQRRRGLKPTARQGLVL